MKGPYNPEELPGPEDVAGYGKRKKSLPGKYPGESVCCTVHPWRNSFPARKEKG